MAKEKQRACDACAIRKVKCDGNQPCERCAASPSLNCTYLKTHAKSGPKGPRRSTTDAIRKLQAKVPDAPRAHVALAAYEELPSQEPPKTRVDSYGESSNNSSTQSGPSPEEAPGFGNSWSPYPSSGSLPFSLENSGRISFATIAHYMEVYQSQGYAVWPVVGTEALLERLISEPHDLELYALATSICAATISQFRIGANEPVSPETDSSGIACLFGAECQRARIQIDYMDRPTTSTLLSSFFLHAYSSNIGKRAASTVLLREAITLAQILGMHKRTYYEHLDPIQQQHGLRIYWLLFISERGHSVQHDIPVTLARAHLPPLHDANDGSISSTFVHLCTLFSILDETIGADSTHLPTRGALEKAQRRLNEDLISSISTGNEIQRADISMTQQWMRIFLWQHSLSVTDLHSEGKDHEFSFGFPAKVAENVLSCLSSLSRESLEAHGPGMETKLFEIANALADVLICVPSIAQQNSLSMGPRHQIHQLSSLLSSFRGGNSAFVSILQEKIMNAGLLVSSPPRLLKYYPEEDQSREQPASPSYG